MNMDMAAGLLVATLIGGNLIFLLFGKSGVHAMLHEGAGSGFAGETINWDMCDQWPCRRWRRIV